MTYLEIDEFRILPEGAIAKARCNDVMIRENGEHLAVMISRERYLAFLRYEEDYWRRGPEEGQ